MKHLCSRKDCCGCLSCYYSCKNKAIELVKDELGFVYPNIVNNKCVDCGNCDKLCPLLNYNSGNTIKSAIGARLIDKSLVAKSTSGGIATYLAKKTIENFGVVYGVSNIDNIVTYERVEDDIGIQRIRGTKYTEPQKDFWHKLSNDIRNNKMILFIGTPCTIAAVKLKYKKYENLYTCELVCHGITSNRVLQEYINYEENKHSSKICEINVRYKKEGNWDPPYLKSIFVNGDVSEELFYTSSIFGYAFLNMSRFSCYRCKFKDDSSAADLTIGDYWGIDKESIIYTKEGVSIILVRTEKGKNLINFDNSIIAENVDLKRVIDNNYPIVSSTEYTKQNEEFINNFRKYPLDIACKKSKEYKKLLYKNKISDLRCIIKRVVNNLYEKEQ